MGIGEDVFAVQPGRRRDNPTNNEKNGPYAGNCGWPNDVMCVLAKRAICVPGTVRVEMHQLDGGTEDQKERKECNEQNSSQGTRCPNSVAQRHN